MRSRNLCLFLAFLAVVVPFNAVADEVLLYDVDFGSPPHTPGLPPVTGAGAAPRDTPTFIRFGNPTVVTALGSLTDQPCAFGNGTSGYDQLQFVTGADYGGGFPEAYDSYYIEMDVLVEELDNVVIWNNFTILLDTPTVRNIYFRPDRTIRFYQPGGGAALGTYEFGVPVALAMNLDIVSGQLIIWLDGEEVFAGQVGPEQLRSVRLNLNGERPDDSAAVDNLRIYGGGSAPCESPTISEHPQSQDVLEGAPVTFTVTAQGTPPLGYQWLKDGMEIFDAVESTYMIDAAGFGDEGVYEVVVYNDCGDSTSDPAFLTVAPAACTDLDGDGDTDWSDIAILAHDWGCAPPDACVGDLDGDGDTDLEDLLLLLLDWGCPDGDGSCDEPGPGVIDVSVIEVDNTAVGSDADPLEPEFDGGVTHFTFDLQITVPPGEDWGAAEGDWVLTDPDVQFFTHALNFGGDPPDPFYFNDYPALEFDSYWCGASDIPPGGSGEQVVGVMATRTASELSRVWLDAQDMGEGTFSIARFTILVPPDEEVIPMVVPAGAGGDDPVVGGITGWVTNSSYTPGCGNFEFDIVLHSTCQCEGDVDNDCDVDWSDLAILLNNYGCSSPDLCYGDLDGDGGIGLTDLAILLGSWGCPDGDSSCDEFGSSVLEVAVDQVDNSDIDPGDDQLAPNFNGGVTHFTFDLHVITDPYEDWGVAEMLAELDEPGVQFFVHPFNISGGMPPNPSWFSTYPALEFDSYWMAASVVESGGSGLNPEQLYWPVRNAAELSALWWDLDDTDAGDFSIARFTVSVPPGGEIHPAVVPAGSGGENPLLGTVTGWVTNTSLNPGCTEVAFDIIDCGCEGDVDGDCDTDLADLATLLSAYGRTPGDPLYVSFADFDNDGDVDLSDLAHLLADYNCGTRHGG